MRRVWANHRTTSVTYCFCSRTPISNFLELMKSLFELGPVTQRHVQTPVRGAVILPAKSVRIDNDSGIRDDRQLLDHRYTDR